MNVAETAMIRMQVGRFSRLVGLTIFASFALFGLAILANASVVFASLAFFPVLLWTFGRPNEDCSQLVAFISAGHSLIACYFGIKTGAPLAFAIWCLAPALPAYAAGVRHALPITIALVSLTSLFVFSPESEENLGIVQAIALIGFAIYLLSSTTVVEHALNAAADRIAQVEARRRMLLDNLEQVALRLDSEGRIREASGGMMEIFGKPETELIGVRLEDLVSDADTLAVRHAFQQAKFRNDYSSVIVRPKDTLTADAAIRIKYRVAPRENHGDPFELIATLSNAKETMAERSAALQATQEAEQARHAQRQFLTNMSHELRTPLNALVGFSELLAFPNEHKLDRDVAQDYAMHIYESGFGLAELVQNLFELNDPDSTYETNTDRQTVLNDAIKQCLRALQIRIQDKGVLIKWEPSETAMKLQIPPSALRQVLLNSLSQLLRMIRPNGWIKISACRKGDTVEICIQDNGIGLSEGIIRKLTHPIQFESAPYVASDTFKILWYAASRNIIERNQGKAHIDGAPGVGTTLTYHLPIAEENMQTDGTSKNTQLFGAENEDDGVSIPPVPATKRSKASLS